MKGNKEGLWLLGTFAACVAFGGIVLFLKTNPATKDWDLGLIASIGIGIFLVVGAIVYFGMKNFIATVIGVILVIFVVSVISIVSIQGRIAAHKQELEDEANATATALVVQVHATQTAIENYKNSQVPPDSVRVYPAKDFAWPGVWGCIFTAAGVLAFAFLARAVRGNPTLSRMLFSLIMMASTFLLSLFFHEPLTWFATLFISLVLFGFARLLYSVFGALVAVFTYFISFYAGAVCASIMAATIFGLGATQVWTSAYLMPSNPYQWIVAGLTSGCPLILYGFWKAPPQVQSE